MSGAGCVYDFQPKIQPTMSTTSDQRSAEFLKIADQFKLGSLVTESSHAVTANLSEVAKGDTAAGLRLLFDVDDDVVRKYEEVVNSGRLPEMAAEVTRAVRAGGKLFFTGCGSTGRLSIQLNSIWRDFWQQRAKGGSGAGDASPGRQTAGAQVDAADLEQRTFSVMAGGDFALIKSVEGFEDFTAFGRRQIKDLGVGKGDVVFAITEGGETSFVIGTAWEGLDAGAKVYFVYNNPDDVLCQHVQRSREVIQEPRIEKLNLTTGPMAITGSTRMQATTIQLCVLLTVLEMAIRELLGDRHEHVAGLPKQFLAALRQAHTTLKSPELLAQLARLVELEERVYRSGHRNNYYASAFAIDVLTDTTERSPTYCTPPFRKFDDLSAAESWAFLFVPEAETPRAWNSIIKRSPGCVEWSPREIEALVGGEKAPRTNEIVRKIGPAELMRFRVGMDGLSTRVLGAGDSAVGVLAERDRRSLLLSDGFHRDRLEQARAAGADTGILAVGRPEFLAEVSGYAARWNPKCLMVGLAVPETGFLLDGVTRAALKMLLNALSTCTMVRLGRVMGNYMIWVVASNLKLIDRATRYIQRLTNLGYTEANQLLFDVVEYVEPRMKADQAYPPVVGVAVMRARHNLDNAAAERRLMSELGS